MEVLGLCENKHSWHSWIDPFYESYA